MERVGRVTRTSSPRTFARPAYSLHGTCRKGDPNVELPNVRSARLRSSLEHVGRVTQTSSPRTFARLWPSWSTPGGNPSVEPPSVRSARFRAHRCMGDFYPIFE